MIHSPLGAGFTVSPNACHTAWTACGGPVKNAQEARSTPRRRGIGVQDRRGIDFRLGRHGEEEVPVAAPPP